MCGREFPPEWLYMETTKSTLFLVENSKFISAFEIQAFQKLHLNTKSLKWRSIKLKLFCFFIIRTKIWGTRGKMDVFTKTDVGRQSFSVYRILYGLVLRCNHIWGRKQLSTLLNDLSHKKLTIYRFLNNIHLSNDVPASDPSTKLAII